MAALTPIRPSPIAGTWYPGNPAVLAREVDHYLDQADLPALPGEVVAVIAPHAGHRYSGGVAGFAFRPVRTRSYDLVAVLSPMHQPYFEPILTTAHAAYSTPLGEVPVDREALSTLNARLKASLGLGLTPVAYDQEHSLEIELPFLQRALAGDFSLLPVMVRTQSAQVCKQLGIALAGILKDRNALLVASTDLSHFYTQDQAVVYDTEMLKRIESFDPGKVIAAEEEEKGFACGLGAVTAALWAAWDLGAKTIMVLKHATSGDVIGDFTSVVGYGAAIAIR